MSRPRGEVRQAIGEAFQHICLERGALVFLEGVTHTELAQRAQVGFELARYTAKNMACAGELRVLEVRPEPGVNRGRVRYAPPGDCPPEASMMTALEDLLRLWSRAR